MDPALCIHIIGDEFRLFGSSPKELEKNQDPRILNNILNKRVYTRNNGDLN